LSYNNVYVINIVSEAPKEPAAAKKFASYNPKFKTDHQKKEEVCITGRVALCRF